MVGDSGIEMTELVVVCGLQTEYLLREVIIEPGICVLIVQSTAPGVRFFCKGTSKPVRWPGYALTDNATQAVGSSQPRHLEVYVL